MSGYLQRLVSSAMRPAPAVHPIVAPLFATPEPVTDGDHPALREEAVDTVPRTVTVDVEPSPGTTCGGELLPAVVPVAATAIPRPDEAPEPPAGRRGRRSERGRSPRIVPADRARAAGAADATLSPSAYRPLLPEASADVLIDRRDADPRSPLGEVPRARSHDARTSRRAASDPSEPDEIRITIGRIEVTAVPEPPARTAARPARNQPSLDEYSKRADARRR